MTASLIASSGQDPLAAVAFIELMDAFLISTGLLIFALGLYELFVHELALPEWLTLHNLLAAKSTLVSVCDGGPVHFQETRMSQSAACLVLRWRFKYNSASIRSDLSFCPIWAII